MRFMCTHSLPPHAVTPEQITQVSQAAQSDPKVRGYRSFFNLSEGHIVCIMEANSEKDVTDWFKKMNLPWDNVVPLEYEGDRGSIREEANIHQTV
jgi:hypothetical protein